MLLKFTTIQRRIKSEKTALKVLKIHAIYCILLGDKNEFGVMSPQKGSIIRGDIGWQGEGGGSKNRLHLWMVPYKPLLNIASNTMKFHNQHHPKVCKPVTKPITRTYRENICQKCKDSPPKKKIVKVPVKTCHRVKPKYKSKVHRFTRYAFNCIRAGGNSKKQMGIFHNLENIEW